MRLPAIAAVPLTPICAVLALAMTWAHWDLAGQPGYFRRLDMHLNVLGNCADIPYQTHMYLFAQAADALRAVSGVRLQAGFMGLYAAGYFLALMGTRFWLEQMRFGPSAVLTAMVTVAAYAGTMLKWSEHHPADPYGAGLFAASLALALAGRRRELIGVCLVAGFVWSKHVLLGPVLLLAGGLRGEWRRGAGDAVAVGLAALVGPLVYRLVLGPHAVVAEGVLSPADCLRLLPKSAVAQLALAGLPALCLWAAWPRVPASLRAATLVYPLIIGLYVVQRYYLFELRSFWICVPVFAALVAACARHLSVELTPAA